MGFSLGLVGLPNSGKTTVFNALSNLNAEAHPYPFCTIDPNVGIVEVPDERLEILGRLLKPEKLTPTTVQFVDVAGLVEGAHKGEGLGNRFLSHIRALDAYAHVVRFFGGSVPHIYDTIDPIRDMEVVETEIVISDLEIVEERLRRLEKLPKSVGKEALRRIKDLLEAGALPIKKELGEEELKVAASLNLITVKPFFVIANVGEDRIGSPDVLEFRRRLEERGIKVVEVSAKLERELAELPKEERLLYMQQYGIERMAIEEVIRTGYEVLGLVTFYTIVGKEVRAWTVRRNTPCQKAAGKIHSDMERGFIKAEVVSFDDFVTAGSEAQARDRGLVRIEGKDYLVKDGDILRIRFSA
jgi:GTP-binding protein YchF